MATTRHVIDFFYLIPAARSNILPARMDVNGRAIWERQSAG
jgi:hypothetical protein